MLASVRGDRAARLGGAGPWVLALPMTYVAGLQVVCRSLVAGHRPVLLDDHASLAGAVAAAGGAPYVSLVATQLHPGARVAGRHGGAGRLLGGAGRAAGRSTGRCASGRATAGIRVVATYGSAETAGGCVYDGLPLDGVAVAIGADGRIRIGGPTLFDGYDGDPALTAEVLVDGWFLTADAGRFDEDGRLQVLGRLDDMVISGGVKVPTGIVAARLREHPARDRRRRRPACPTTSGASASSPGSWATCRSRRRGTGWPRCIRGRGRRASSGSWTRCRCSATARSTGDGCGVSP